jgi:hypothetical protein
MLVYSAWATSFIKTALDFFSQLIAALRVQLLAVGVDLTSVERLKSSFYSL